MMDAPDKASLRQHYRAVRDAIPAAQRQTRSHAIAHALLAHERVQGAASVFIYVAAGSEVGTRELIQACLAAGKSVAVPRIEGGKGLMQPIVIRAWADLAPGRLGILEPTTHNPLTTTPDLTIVPGLAFTQAGERLGQGGGYYDRYLAQHPETYKLALCFTEQRASHLPTDEHDIPMDQVITA